LDLKLVEQLLALMDQGGLTELHVVDGDQEVRLSRRDDSAGPVVVGAAPAPMMAAPVAAPAAPAPAEAPAPSPVEEGTLFRSPMVGTFYARPNPDADAYVSVGDSFGDGTVLCILEAMKVFNEIKAETSGTVLEVLVQDGDAVEYDQPLFRYKAS
jgi:acetyl-CoA carboxylase biotin carboxyl carrier protein